MVKKSRYLLEVFDSGPTVQPLVLAICDRPVYETWKHSISTKAYCILPCPFIVSFSRKILIAGATGKQGLSLVCTFRNSTFQVLALTHDPTGPKAKGLVNEPHVEVVQGDLDNSESIQRIFDMREKGSIWGVFMVLTFPGLGANADGEEWQGIVSYPSLILHVFSFN